MVLLSRFAILALIAFAAQAGVEDGWQTLFDGTSLSGWRAGGSADSWHLEDGAIVARGPQSHLYYVGDSGSAVFRNFELEADVKTRPGANSGIYFHTRYQQSGSPPSGLEVQINNTYAGSGAYRERKKTGSLYGIRNVYSQIVSDDQWFRLHVTVRGRQVRVLVNDQLTVDYMEPVPPAGTGDNQARVLSAGTFALQAHDPNSTVSFRNIRVRRLPDDVKTETAPPVVDDAYRELLRLSGANFPVVDYHTHLKEGLSLAEVQRRWLEQGIYAGVAVNGGLSFPVSSDAGLEPFLAELRGKPLFVAFQAEGREWVRLFSPAALERFDYVFTDAMTWSDDTGKRMRLWIDAEVGVIPDAQRFMQTLVDRTVGIISNEPIDLYVNPTFLPSQLAARYDELWTADRVDRVVAALRASGVAMEINNRYRIPSAAIIRRARDAGVQFACGTNNTGPRDLGRMEYCIQMIRECGLTWADMWVPPPAGQKAIQRRRRPRAMNENDFSR